MWLYELAMNISATATGGNELFQMLITAVGSLGFPIVACFMMYRQNEKLESRHEEESKQFAKAIENNTLAIQHLTDKIGGN